jgi:hypothetical protein
MRLGSSSITQKQNTGLINGKFQNTENQEKCKYDDDDDDNNNNNSVASVREQTIPT